MEEGDIDKGIYEMIQYYNTRAGSNDGSARRAACELDMYLDSDGDGGDGDGRWIDG